MNYKFITINNTVVIILIQMKTISVDRLNSFFIADDYIWSQRQQEPSDIIRRKFFFLEDVYAGKDDMTRGGRTTRVG